MADDGGAVMTPLSVTQQAVFEVAVELARQDNRLAALAAGLPLPEDFDPDTLPNTVEMELYSRIQAVKSDHLQPTIALLFAGAQLADADLRREFLDLRRPHRRDRELDDLRKLQDGVSFRQETQSPIAPGRKDTPC